MTTINVPEQIKKIRANLGITQTELALKIGHKDRQKIADYETNRSRIAAEDWIKIQSLEKELLSNQQEHREGA